MSLLLSVNLLWFALASALQLLPVAYLVWRWNHADASGRGWSFDLPAGCD